MTQENKELLLKDLCSRLPYGVKIKVPSWDEREMEYVDRIDVLYSINGDEYIKSTNEDYDFDLEDIKPYLFPLSSMTEEQLFEVRQILGKDWEIEKDFIHLNTAYVVSRTLSYLELQALFEWFNKNHFDYRGLIEKGLALEAPEGMYN